MSAAAAPARLVAAILAVTALLASACSSEPDDPAERLTQAVERTFAGSFRYSLTARADRDALAAIGEDAGIVASVLNTFELAGTIDGDRTSLEIRLAGGEPALTVRSIGGEDVYVQLGLLNQPGFSLVGPDTGANLVARMEDLGLPRSVREATTALFGGLWIGVEGAFEDPTGLLAPTAGASEGAGGSLVAGLGGSLPGFVRRFVNVIEEDREDGTRRYAIRLELHALLRTVGELTTDASASGLVDLARLEDQLGRLPEQVDGEIVTTDGVVTAIVFDIAAAARAGGQDVPGTIKLQLAISEHGRPPVVERPADPVIVPSHDLATALQVLLRALGG